MKALDTSSWFIGKNSSNSNELCTSKAIGTGFGSYAGLCPEAPTQEGTYLMSGIAHYANTNRIRTDLTIPAARENSRDLMVSSYGIALATNVPKIEITVGNITSLSCRHIDWTGLPMATAHSEAVRWLISKLLPKHPLMENFMSIGKTVRWVEIMTRICGELSNIS